ncbi:ganglioside GM2 activator-like [Bacillus rossius redtenbacheri]|uniref:ganglioside GM2 activator-like n=1 Tax=Bacillus rossius redtenbacheri TaxID=93214 RepID=UPI002FDDF53F
MFQLARCAALLLLLWRPALGGFFSKRKVLIGELTFDSCSAAPGDDPVQFWDVAVRTTDEGDLLVSGSMRNFVELRSPLKASVSMKRNILGLWVPVPCIKDFGSCDFEDLCSYAVSPAVQCIPLLDEHDVPCHCPVEEGVYTLPSGQFRVSGTRWAGVLAGRYKGTVTFSRGGQRLACYNASFTLE